MDETPFPIVGHVGSGFTMAGSGGDDEPRTIFPTNKIDFVDVELAKRDYNLRLEFTMEMDAACLHHHSPVVECGIVRDWDRLEQIWQYCFDVELGVDPTKQSLVMPESGCIPKSQREQMAELFLEKFQVPSLGIINAPLATLFASGRTCGMVVSSGYSHTWFGACVGNMSEPLRQMYRSIRFGGRDVDLYLEANSHRIMGANFKERYFSMKGWKREHCFVRSPSPPPPPRIRLDGGSFDLPDGNTIEVSNDCCDLFEGPVADLERELQGVLRKIEEEEIKRDLLGSIILSGGNSLTPGFGCRLRADMMAQFPDYRVQVVDAPERWFCEWIGSSIFASVETFRHYRFTRAMLDEYGPMGIHRYCF